ncbi:MAG: hypothetical protein ACYDGM_07905 [Vulcanimicrobiaceae bacterium]
MRTPAARVLPYLERHARLERSFLGAALVFSAFVVAAVGVLLFLPPFLRAPALLRMPPSYVHSSSGPALGSALAALGVTSMVCNPKRGRSHVLSCSVVVSGATPLRGRFILFPPHGAAR